MLSACQKRIVTFCSKPHLAIECYLFTGFQFQFELFLTALHVAPQYRAPVRMSSLNFLLCVNSLIASQPFSSVESERAMKSLLGVLAGKDVLTHF